ncbi:phospholipase D family protein [Gilvimarinus sp. SDUM040013]|uniref:Phospholipase D family protein n=1 Tax=Gilvimarinus gilvus TaxID=3058038 RepID=A0ABU4S0Q0_9GAMM|nr:phospholipase D family protein [Gilvimarinus sp. SDUM040013]MDO3384903.1 phospholipase D family protein [Gilvimarinus sp. SDUM040013]MDX6850672.1 phospholipase D family protein [Gilvimarinus sp. SDUM040013]
MNKGSGWIRRLPDAKWVLLSCAFMLGCASAPERSGINAHYVAGTSPAGYFKDLDVELRATGDRLGTGVRLLASGVDAVAARVDLIRKAQHTLDVQYYLFHGDATGILLFRELWMAAERGVKVRLLLDDLEQRAGDYPLNILNSHANIEVRLYNPFYWRRARAWQLLGEFSRLNHRMHNKSLTADNLASVVGGRNVGDEYFSANQSVNFGDADVFLIGDSVPAVTGQFDDYWNSDLVYPLSVLNSEPPAPDLIKRAGAEIDAAVAQLNAIEYLQVVNAQDWLGSIRRGERALYWAPVDVWSDTPDLQLFKQKDSSNALVVNRLWQLFENAESELFLISPYFVPAQAGTQLLTGRAQEGVTVSVVTNALAATDVVAVHSGYAQSREALLAAGTEIFEIKRTPNTERKVWSVSSTSSLHAKVFVVDRRWVFVGSFNLDPRSAWLNTEMGVLIDSPELAEAVLTGTRQLLNDTSYQVSLNDEGELYWRDLHSGQTFSKEPNASWWRRAMSSILSFLPIESQL